MVKKEMEKEFNIQIQKKLQEILKEKFNNSQSDLAEMIKTSQSNVSRWISGKFSPNLYTIKKICDCANISIDYFFNNSKDINLLDTKDNSIKIPSYSHKTKYIPENLKESKDFDVFELSKNWIEKTFETSIDTIFSIQMPNDSMEPILHKSDTIFAQRILTNNISEGLYVINHNGSIIIKNLQYKTQNKLKIISSNQNYDTYEIDLTENNNFEIIGKTLFILRYLN
jgi:transcriptional regulator with XRE-family HTH domain